MEYLHECSHKCMVVWLLITQPCLLEQGKKILETSNSIDRTLVHLQKHPYKVQKFVEECVARLEIVEAGKRVHILITRSSLIVDGDDHPAFELGWRHLQWHLINVQENFDHGGLVDG